MKNIQPRLTLVMAAGLCVATTVIACPTALAQKDSAEIYEQCAGVGAKDGQDSLATGAQTLLKDARMEAPKLQGATNGTVGPQGDDASIIMGINTAGTVRVNNLANLEALLNIIANGMEILGIAWGGPTLIYGFMAMAAGTQDAMKRIIWGCSGVTGGLATPGAINWLVASARDANLFS